MKRKVHVVINPAFGRPKPILHNLIRIFKQAEVDWDISLTKARGDAKQQLIKRGRGVSLGPF